MTFKDQSKENETMDETKAATLLDTGDVIEHEGRKVEVISNRQAGLDYRYLICNTVYLICNIVYGEHICFFIADSTMLETFNKEPV